MDKILFTKNEYNKLVSDVTVEDAIDYLLHDTMSNSTESKKEYEEIVHPVSMATVNYLKLLKDLQDRTVATDYVIDRYEKDLEILSKIDFNIIFDAVGADAEQALENCVSAMEDLIKILKAIKIKE